MAPEHVDMALHPWVVVIFFVLFALLSVSTFLSMVKQRKNGLAALMFVSIVACAASAFISSTVSSHG